jgi:hypothetical protein
VNSVSVASKVESKPEVTEKLMDAPKNKHHVDVKATIKAGNNLDLANY